MRKQKIDWNAEFKLLEKGNYGTSAFWNWRREIVMRYRRAEKLYSAKQNDKVIYVRLCDKVRYVRLCRLMLKLSDDLRMAKGLIEADSKGEIEQSEAKQIKESKAKRSARVSEEELSHGMQNKAKQIVKELVKAEGLSIKDELILRYCKIILESSSVNKAKEKALDSGVKGEELIKILSKASKLKDEVSRFEKQVDKVINFGI